MIVVSDTSPLSGLAIADHLSLLQQLYGQVVIPAAVAEELKRGSLAGCQAAGTINHNSPCAGCCAGCVDR